jgi:hypothetical protein
MHVTTGDVMRLYRAWAGFGQEVIARPVALTWAAGGRVAETVAESLQRSWQTEAVMSEIGREYASLAAALLAVPSAAAGTAVAQFDAPDRDPMGRWLGGAAPLGNVSQVAVDHDIAVRQRRELARRAGFKGDEALLDLPEMTPGAPFLLPARVLDASQAWASWFVPVAAARKMMEEACALGHQPPEVLEAFEPVTVGPGEAMVTLLASDYRASDFGVTQEIGLTLSVTPRGMVFPDPGQMFLRLIVTDAFSLAAARQIWGIRKDFWDNAGARTPRGRLEAAYAADRVRFGLGALLPGSAGGTFLFDAPRFGMGRSERLPAVVYSMVEPRGLPPGPVVPARSEMIRSGVREGMQFGGSVKLSLPESRSAGEAAGCLCAGGMACLCETLRGLGLDRRRPAANGWTERMSCTLDEPAPLADQPSGKTSA